MKVFFDMIGCRLNQSEIEHLAIQFRVMGHEIVAEANEADLAIVNTCAVTVKAAADSRKKLRRAGRLGSPKVIATGCWATLYPEEALRLAGVTDVVTNADKESLPFLLFGEATGKISAMELVREPLPGDRARTRAFIKVQEGCDNHCTYCLTRLAREKSRSRAVKAIKQDIAAARAGGAKEIVLTGVQLGAWGRDLGNPKTLKDLISTLLACDEISRLRLSSIEPWDFDLEMLELWRDERMCRHLHIPLQSGSDRILKWMGRPITTSQYALLVARARERIPDVAITTDVIVGFPGETEEDFIETKQFVCKMGFAGGHVFTYSPRPGTAAFKLTNRVPGEQARTRNAALRKIFNESGRAFRDQFLNLQMAVLWESSERLENGTWRLSGLTDNYIRIYTEADEDLWNEISNVKMISQHGVRSALIGKL